MKIMTDVPSCKKLARDAAAAHGHRTTSWRKSRKDYAPEKSIFVAPCTNPNCTASSVINMLEGITAISTFDRSCPAA